MRSTFKITILLLLLQSLGISVGTQFLSIPKNNLELISGYNPIINKQMSQPVISVTYGSWLADMKLTNISLSKGILNGYGGLKLRYISLNDLELRSERPSDEPISLYTSSAYTIDTWYGREFGSLSMQMAIRYLSIQLYDEYSDGFAMDLAISKNINDKYTLGAAVLNIGRMNEMYEQKPELPIRVLLGAQIEMDFESIENKLSFIVEKSTLIDEFIFRFSDYIRYNKLQFMLGSQYTKNNVSVSGGVNITLGNYTIGYAVNIGSQALGIPQYLNLSINLP